MKKYINKLFNLLGYIPKKEYTDILKSSEKLREFTDSYQIIMNSVRNNKVNYLYEEIFGYFMVQATAKDSKGNIEYNPIKIFRFNENNKDYIRLCVEELCELLNDDPNQLRKNDK